jgi:HK97 family phage portal protein
MERGVPWWPVVGLPWKRKPAGVSAGASSGGIPSLFGAAVPGPGVQGDVEGFLELWRRRAEQTAIDAGSYAGGPGGWAPYVSEWGARQVPALTSGLRLISGLAMQLPLLQKRNGKIVDPPATIITNPTPGPNRTIADFVDEYISDMLIYGNYAALIGPLDSTAWPTMLVPLDVTTVSVGRDPATWQPLYAVEGIEEPIAADAMFHVALDKRSTELKGRGLLPTLTGAIGAALAADAYAGRYFQESAVPSGVITDTRPNLTQAQADELKSKWMMAVSGTRVPVVIPTSTSFQPLATDADKAQLVQARQWDATTVAMTEGVPPFLLGIETQRHTYTNAETEFGRFVATTILRLLKPLEQQLSEQCLPRGNKAEFATEALLRPDSEGRSRIAVNLYGAGIITLEEARSTAGFPAEGGPESTAVPTPAPAPSSVPAGAGNNGDASARLHLVEV